LDYLNATALVVTFLLNNSNNNNTAALAWEEQFLKMAAAGIEGLNLYYSSEVSLSLSLLCVRVSLANDDDCDDCVIV